MARCDWCGKTGKDIEVTNNGRTVLRLCSMCQAEYEIRLSPLLTAPAQGARKPGLWQRVRNFFESL